jgi:hypothetical protein
MVNHEFVFPKREKDQGVDQRKPGVPKFKSGIAKKLEGS